MQSMTQEVAVKVLNLIKKPPAKDAYHHIKDRFSWMFALDNYAQCDAIANLPLSGNTQPSNLMSQMLGLLPAGMNLVFSSRVPF